MIEAKNMTDIIWGNGTKIISTISFEMNVTHRKDGNSDKYNDVEKITISDVDLPGRVLIVEFNYNYK